MESMSTEETQSTAEENALLRRRGDRRVQVQAVADDRRKGDRRDLPGISALIRTLFRHGSKTES
jgi:hypothetical protein